MNIQVALLLIFAATSVAQVAANPRDGKHYSPIPLLTLSENSTSVNVVPYQSTKSLYYLGYKEEDWYRPFVKYWKPAIKQISDEVQKGITESPRTSSLAFKPQEPAHYLTQPGYLQLENGWAVTDDNKLMIAVRNDMGNVTGDMYDWWFGWHLVDPQRYKLWHPVAHQYADRMPNAIDWSNKTLPERYIGSYSWIDEFIGNFATKLTVNFVDPATLGFNTSDYEPQGIETIVMAHITSGHTTNVTGNSYLMHQIRRKDDGQRELRSRFFLDVFGETQGHDLSVHCAVEMSHLATFLPQLFDEFKNTI
ncbi:phloretin hydrolase [Fusarium tjaetaba]|uniref:Phloretin hydrolase n=1 Tax=Fusarium tjaetaba TaxID=1567544 RepID=A0A8H5S8D7_9HYPO|nr:phloretin hydrolase [Fusarium tjaetaba]KAF5648446.1 phloretin hydrolase [Fusarium tjaetaba]